MTWRRGRHQAGLPALIEDLLESWDGRWFTRSALEAIVTDRYPHVTAETFARAYQRVKADPRIPIELRELAGWPPEIRCPERRYLSRTAS